MINLAFEGALERLLELTLRRWGMKTVSIIVATYRRGQELARALESLATQTYPRIEIVVVDDNANDEWNFKVAQIIENFKNTHPVITLNYIVNNTNQGSAKSRNIGIYEAKGEYITFLDDDDIYLAEKVKNQVEFMIDGEYDYSITDLYLYGEDDKLMDKRVRYYVKDTSKDSLQTYHLKYNLTGTDTMMFTKDYIVKIGAFAPIDVGDEYYLMQRAIDGGGKFGYLNDCQIKAFVHKGEGGLSSGEGKIKGENALYEYKKQVFKNIDAKTRRYVRMRHYAVIAFAEHRRGRKLKFVTNSFKSFFSAPIACMKMFLEKMREKEK